MKYKIIKTRQYGLMERTWLLFNLVIVLAVSVYFLMWQNMVTAVPGYEFFTSPGHEGDLLIITLAICAILVNIAFIVALFAGFERKLIFFGDEGPTTVSLQAIEQALASAAESVPEVSRLKVRVLVPKRGRGPLLVEAIGTINDVYDIRTVTQKIQQTMKARVNRMLQIEEEITFSVHFNKILSGKEKKVHERQLRKEAAAELEPQETEQSFPIKYPIDDEINAN